jgi:hypothetical protein
MLMASLPCLQESMRVPIEMQLLIKLLISILGTHQDQDKQDAQIHEGAVQLKKNGFISQSLKQQQRWQQDWTCK